MRALEDLGYTNLVHLTTSGEGEVYTCEKQGKKFIIKVVGALKNEQLEMLKRVNKLHSEYFPRIFDIISREGKTIIIREFITGTTLAEDIRKNMCFSYPRAREIVLDISNALRELHSMQPHPIVYRDLKPDNIIITPDGKAKLIDFGIARYYKQEATRDTLLAGTKGYTAPEVLAGMQSDVRSDIYSLGLLFYELLSGKSLRDPPYQIRPVAENNEFVPDYVDEIIAKAADINQTNRYSSIEEFVYDLENKKEIKQAQKRKKRKKRITIAIAVILGLSAILSMLFLFDEKVETLLALDFEDERDIYHIEGYRDAQPRFYVKDGVLNITDDGCNLEYMPANGMLVHVRLKTSPTCGMIGVGRYRIGPALEFECIYYDEKQNLDMTTWYRDLQGTPVVNAGQWLDFIIYTNKQNTAVYAFVCDNESQNIAYTAYQIPEFFDEDVFPVEMMVWIEDKNDYFIVDSIHIVEGSLKHYLKENMPAYTRHRS
jgi:serine/threonine protein kinase